MTKLELEEHIIDWFKVNKLTAPYFRVEEEYNRFIVMWISSNAGGVCDGRILKSQIVNNRNVCNELAESMYNHMHIRQDKENRFLVDKLMKKASIEVYAF